jgi:hypothetical protein
LSVGGIGGSLLEARDGGVTRVDHGLERSALMAHVTLDGFDEIWNQVVAASELNVDLREAVTHSVAHVYQIVVHLDCPENDGGEYDDDYEYLHQPAPRESA